MSQTSSFTIANLAGAGYRAAVNAALQALASSNGGTTEPTETHPFMFWADATSGLMKIRNAANTGWINSLPLTLVISEFAATLLDDVDAAAMRATLGAAEDSNLVHQTGPETIAGIKTFSSSPVVPTLSVGDSSTKAANAAFVAMAGNTPYPPDYLSGFIAKNNATDANNDIDLGIGYCRDSANAYNLSLAATMTKRLDAAWAAGTNQGGLFSGSKAVNTTYFLHVIRKDSDGSIDWGFDTSLTAANKPAGYGAYRCVNVVTTDSSGNIVQVSQMETAGGGLRVDYLLTRKDVDVTNLGTTPVAYTLSTPIGIEVEANIGFRVAKTSSAVAVDVYVPAKTAETATGGEGRSISPEASSISSLSVGKITVRTNSSAQVMAVASVASTSLVLNTYGFAWGRR